MRSFALVTALSLSGCMLFFDDGGKRPPDQCDELATGNGRSQFEPAPLRNPETLRCESFGGGCNPECGPCPQTELAPIPTWGICGSSCDSLDEATCTANTGCRVVRDAKCAVAGNCVTDFVGCFPVDNQADPSVACNTATDSWTCSRSDKCTALHAPEEACGLDGICDRRFALCITEGADPGRCNEPVTCRAVGPDCPTNSKPGIKNGCFTGVCIPLTLCE